MTAPARVRIAPSPTGDPHVGTAYTGLFNWLVARQTKGSFILRIEDTDRQRSTRESEEAIFRSLRWLGLEWDEGPDIGGPHAPYRQSERLEVYREHVDRLLESGHAFRCFCSPEELAEQRHQQLEAKTALGYPGTCRSLDRDEGRRRAAAGEAHVVRLAVDRGGTTSFVDELRGEITIENQNIDDQVLLKSDGYPTYHLANVVDDHCMKITLVLRAEEWIPSTPKHVLLYRAFGWTPPAFCHLPLLRNSDRSKISKRKNPTSLDYYREKGYLPEALLNFLALMGYSPSEGEGSEVFSLEELRQRFDRRKISLGGPVFDLTKLEWLNGEWIRRLGREELAERLQAFLPPGPATATDFLLRVLPLVQERLKTLADYASWVDFFLAKEIHWTRDSFQRARLDRAALVRVLRQAHATLGASAELDVERDGERLREDARRLGIKVGDFFMALRVAVTGKTATPPLLESMQVLGKEESLRRIQAAVHYLEGQPEPSEL